MLTLGDIDSLFPDSFDGSVFSDLHKDVYGFRPRYINFSNIEEFNIEFEYLIETNNRQIEEEAAAQAKRVSEFETHVEKLAELLNNNNREDLLWVVVDAEGIDREDIKFYGWERFEFELDLPYGYINKSLEK